MKAAPRGFFSLRKFTISSAILFNNMRYSKDNLFPARLSVPGIYAIIREMSAQKESPMISIVTPVYNEEDNVVYFHDEVTRVMKTLAMDYEILYVNDGSTDSTEDKLRALAAADPHVRAVTFARNFGHQIAITCGMDLAEGDAVITMDGDMQHPPALIPALVEKWQEGYDIVQAVRTATEDAGFVKRATSSGYYAVINAISDSPVQPGGSDFRLLDRKALLTFRRFREHSRFIRGIIGGMGYRQASVEYVAPARHAGVSKFSMKKMLHLAMDGILANSTVPLRMVFYLGVLSMLLGCLLILYIFGCWLMDSTVPGWATMTILVSFYGSLNLLCLGILGEYVSRIFREAQNRPLYWIGSDTADDPQSPWRRARDRH